MGIIRLKGGGMVVQPGEDVGILNMINLPKKPRPVFPKKPRPTFSHIPGLQGELYGYQFSGVDGINRWGGRAALCDEMGLGKTVQALAWLQLHPQVRPVVVVCPAVVKWGWKERADEWMAPGTRTVVLEGTEGGKPPQADIYIVNYDILGRRRKGVWSGWGDGLKSLQPQAVVVDEMHYCKNEKAIRTIAVQMLCEGVPHIIGMSGTPIENCPMEFYPMLRIIRPNLFPSFWAFAQTYCDAKHDGSKWVFNGASNLEQLNRILTSRVMIRRLKKDVLTDLPPKIYSNVPIDIDNRKEYEKAENDFASWAYGNGEEGAHMAGLAKVEALKQLSMAGKMKGCIEWIEDFMENYGGKLVMFGTHIKTMDSMMAAFPGKIVKIDGRDSDRQRQEAQTRFQDDPQIRLFVGNIRAAGVGIDKLKVASHVAFLEYPWTPGELDQAADRCHRIGQKDTVNVWNLIAHDTIEDKIIRLLCRKKKVVRGTLDGHHAGNESILLELIQQFAGKPTNPGHFKARRG